MTCGHDPARPEVAIGGILFNPAGEILLIRRGQPPASGYWSIPGGRLEPGETILEACRREFLEETGLEVEVGSLVAVAERVQEGFHFVILDFLVMMRHSVACSPRAGSDATQVHWVATEKLSEYPLVEGLQGVIETVAAEVRRGTLRGLRRAEGRIPGFSLYR